jgi:hypothetical protein
VSETALIVGVTLLAVLVGALLPVLYQLMQTLRETRRVLNVVESHAKDLKPAVEAAAEIGQSIRQMKNSLKTTASLATALGPPLVALLRALRGDEGEPGRAREGKGTPKGAGGVPGSVGPTVTDGVGREERHHGVE